MALDYQLDRKVHFSTESQYQSLYKWFLYETDDAGKKIDRDQIPWNWNLNFTALNIELVEELSLSRYGEDNQRPEERTHIRAKLRPGYANEDGSAPFYSMFGTKRIIESFELVIFENTEPDKGERCVLWGSPSYTTEIDFHEETTDDTIQVTLLISPERFAHYVDKVRNHPPSLVSLRLGGVSGFYSDWSPAIFTHSIKVLTNLEDHGLAMPEDVGFTPPVLGAVEEYALFFFTKRECYAPRSVEPDDGEEITALLEEKKLSPAEESVLLQRNTFKLSLETVKRLKQLTYAAWTIAVILVILALTKIR